MISPDTPPGTDVICIEASPGQFGPSRLTLGAIYTVKKIHPAEHEGFVVELHEVGLGWGYNAQGFPRRVGHDLRRFRYLDLGNLESMLRRYEREEIREILFPVRDNSEKSKI